MITVKIDQLELLRVWSEQFPTVRTRVNFPLSKAVGTASTAVVYFEIDPGQRLATHTDSAEETLLILEGTAEVTLGDEREELTTGEMAVVPAMAPHGVRNVGDSVVRVLGFFSSNTLVSTFEQPLMPFNQSVVRTPPTADV
jgi:quercetin dioxygenase-like cupin family protein